MSRVLKVSQKPKLESQKPIEFGLKKPRAESFIGKAEREMLFSRLIVESQKLKHYSPGREVVRCINRRKKVTKTTSFYSVLQLGFFPFVEHSNYFFFPRFSKSYSSVALCQRRTVGEGFINPKYLLYSFLHHGSRIASQKLLIQ